jgi:hypothetical protein
MINEAEFVGLNDRPALLALSSPEWIDATRTVLNDVGYKVHAASNHDDFIVRYGRIQYQVVLLEELFCANSIEENLTLRHVQLLPMAQRRHSVFVLLGQLLQHPQHPAGLSAERPRRHQPRRNGHARSHRARTHCPADRGRQRSVPARLPRYPAPDHSGDRLSDDEPAPPRRPQRLDEALVARGLSPSREQAQRLIRAGAVLVNQQPADKPGRGSTPDAGLSPWSSHGRGM